MVVAYVVDWEIDSPVADCWSAAGEGFDQVLPSVPAETTADAAGDVIAAPASRTANVATLGLSQVK